MAGNDERVEGIPHFDIHITDRNLDVSARTLISHIKKEWKIDKLQQKIFDDGISNKLVGYYVRPEHTKDGVVNKADHRSDMVLLRIYGAKTELFIDRAKELRNFQLLRKNGLAPRLYSTFENGYCYAFVEGRVLGPDDVRQDGMLERCAKLFARVHALKIDQEYLHHHKMESNMFDGLKKLLRLLPAKFDDPEKQSRYENKIPSFEILKQEVTEIAEMLSSTSSPISFCHNDGLCANFIFDEEKDKLWLIDYEYASINHAAYDIGNHFNEFAGVQDVDYGKYPGKEMQITWLKAYLEEAEKLKWKMEPELTDGRLQELYSLVNKFALASHLYWGIWAIVQAYNSEIDFDFLGYAIIRLNEYTRRKPEFMAL